jgi:uncharacterized protein (DUF433 family)
VPVRALFKNLEDGARVDDFLECFPGFAREQVERVLCYGARNLPPSPAYGSPFPITPRAGARPRAFAGNR